MRRRRLCRLEAGDAENTMTHPGESPGDKLWRGRGSLAVCPDEIAGYRYAGSATGACGLPLSECATGEQQASATAIKNALFFVNFSHGRRRLVVVVITGHRAAAQGCGNAIAHGSTVFMLT